MPTPASSGINSSRHPVIMDSLDSRFRGNDNMFLFVSIQQAFEKNINIKTYIIDNK